MHKISEITLCDYVRLLLADFNWKKVDCCDGNSWSQKEMQIVEFLQKELDRGNHGRLQ